jgi:hypothetical protein
MRQIGAPSGAVHVAERVGDGSAMQRKGTVDAYR